MYVCAVCGITGGRDARVEAFELAQGDDEGGHDEGDDDDDDDDGGW